MHKISNCLNPLSVYQGTAQKCSLYPSSCLLVLPSMISQVLKNGSCKSIQSMFFKITFDVLRHATMWSLQWCNYGILSQILHSIQFQHTISEQWTTVCRRRRKFIRTVLCCTVYCNCVQLSAHTWTVLAHELQPVGSHLSLGLLCIFPQQSSACPEYSICILFSWNSKLRSSFVSGWIAEEKIHQIQ